MIGPCSPCKYYRILKGTQYDIAMCKMCKRIKLMCPHCEGTMREDHRYNFQEFSCVRCNHTTNLRSIWG